MARILIIDDQQQILDILSRMLQQEGHETVTALDGKGGMEKAADQTIDVILQDLHLPGELSGMDLVRKIHELRPDCPLIIISGYPTPERLEECRQLGISDFLTKPFEMRFINSVIARVLKNKKNHSLAN